jgi:hypothetical protein
MPNKFSIVLLSLLALSQGAVMLAVELNRTHATHPAWPGHARFHLVWQNVTTACFSLFTVALLWWPGPYGRQRFYCAAAITAIPLAGFLLAHSIKALYGGTLSDPDGVPPLRLNLGGRHREIDGNTLAVLLGTFVLLASVLSFH